MKTFKRTLGLLLSLMIVIAMVPVSLIESAAAELNSDIASVGTETVPAGLEYRVAGDAVTITGYKGTATKLTIPAEIEGLPVTAFDSYALQNRGNIETIVLPDTVEKIGVCAFASCIKLTSINVPDSVTYIGNGAFKGCSRLTSITIPDGVTRIGVGAFQGCSRLTSVVIPQGVDTIYQDTFRACTNLTSVKFLGNIEKIGDYAFYGCKSLEKIDLPDGVTTIEKYAFYNCTNLTSITIPESVTTIESYAFYYCNKLTDVYYGSTREQWDAVDIQEVLILSNNTTSNGPLLKATVHFKEEDPEGPVRGDFGDYEYKLENGIVEITGYNGNSANLEIQGTIQGYPVTSIGERAFFKCKTLNTVTIPEGITDIKSEAFYGCNNLKKINVPNGVAYIGSGAFKGCSYITSLTLPDSVTYIGNEAFMNCARLVSLSIPDSVAYIGISTFRGCGQLSEIVVPKGVKTIYHDTFRSSGVKNVELPIGVKNIGYNAFNYCLKLDTIKLPVGVTTIAKNAFYYCNKLLSITIPSTVTSIEDYAFYNCSALRYVYYGGTQEQWDAIKISNSNKSNNALLNAKLCFIEEDAMEPDVSEDAIIGVSGDYEYKLENGVIEITRYTGKSANLVIPDMLIDYPVTSIGFSAFLGCETLVNVTIPEGITTIDKNAFAYCIALESVSIPESMTEIDSYVFNGCTSLSEIYIPKSVAKLSNTAFDNCISLVNINADEKNEEYASVHGVLYSKDLSVLYKYPAGKKATYYAIFDTVTTVSNGAFAAYTKLKTLDIPTSVKIIGDSAFSGCSQFTDIYYKGTEEEYRAIEVGSNNQLFLDATVHYERVPLRLYFTNTENWSVVNCRAWNSKGDITSAAGIPMTFLFLNSYGKDVYYCDLPADTIGVYFNGGTLVNSKTFEIEGNNLVNGYGYIPKTLDHYSSTEAFRWSFDTYVFEDYDDSKGVIESDHPYKRPSRETWKIYRENAECIHVTFSEDTSLQNKTVELRDYIDIFDGERNSIGRYRYDSLAGETVTIEGDTVYIYLYTSSDCSAYGFRVTNITAEYPEVPTEPSEPEVPTEPSEPEVPTDPSEPEEPDVPEEPDFIYILDEETNEATITKYVGTSTRVEVPQFIDGYKIIAIGDSAFSGTTVERVSLPEGLTSIGTKAFADCSELKEIVVPSTLEAISPEAFANCSDLLVIYLPESVNDIFADSFYSSTVLLVHEYSYAHIFAELNNYLYILVNSNGNPMVNFGAKITGKVTYADGSAAAGATVELINDDGTLKEFVDADENGVYTFVYAEVGTYTISATDYLGNTANTQIAVKQLNSFGAFVAGETDLVFSKSYHIYGNVSEGSVFVTLANENGKVIQSIICDEDGSFRIKNIPNGTYIISAKGEGGSVNQEITIYNGSISDLNLTLIPEAATVVGYAQVEDREGNKEYRNWVDVTIYNSEGIVVAKTKTDSEGMFIFENLTVGEYSIVAEAYEMRPDMNYGYQRNHKLTGYVYLCITQTGECHAETVVLKEEKETLAGFSGKVTANGETQDCQVILRDANRNEIARVTTKKNGKFSFSNICDGVYYILAITKSNGMGYTVITVKDGEVYGDTDIRVYKSDKIQSREARFEHDVPTCHTREEALLYKDRIAEEKNFYDGLSEKEKKQLSEFYVERLNRLSEWITNVQYETSEGVSVEQGGLVVSGSEIQNQSEIRFNLNVEKVENWQVNENGIETEEDYIYHDIHNVSGDNEIKQYYEITMSKTTDGEEKGITSVYKDTDAMGKFRITMTIPEEYRGYAHYSMVHVHNGEVVTLVDLDDDPDTITIEVDKFSTFVLTATNTVLASAVEDDYSATFAGASISLGGNIAVNFHMTLSENILADENAKVEFTLQNGNKQTVYVKDAEATEDGYYVFTCEVNAIQLSDTINAQVVATEYKSEVYSYSVVKYAESLLEAVAGGNTQYADALPLVTAMLNYGANAQQYFEYNTDNLANRNLDEADKVLEDVNLSAYKPVTTGNEAGVRHYGTSLTLKSETELNVYFVIEDESDIPEFYVNGEVAIPVKVGDYYRIKIEDIAAQNLGTEYVVTVGNLEVKSSAMSYGYAVMYSKDENLKNVAKALYAYNQAAKAYIYG